MVAGCLSCEEIEAKICALYDQITDPGCYALITKEGDTTIDRTAWLNSKVDVLKVYQDLFKSKKCGNRSELFEFIHVPCVKPSTCVGTGCLTVPRQRNSRRYRGR